MRISIAAALAALATVAGSAAAQTPDSRTAAMYVADCKSGDPDRRGSCELTFMIALMADSPTPTPSGIIPGTTCAPADGGPEQGAQQAQEAADWLKAHPEFAGKGETDSVRLAARTLWPCRK